MRAFFELGGGLVFNMAFNASSNLIGASVSLSVLRVFGFFFARFFTYSLSAPSGLPISLVKKSKLAGQPVPSNALLVSKAFSFGLLNSNLHPLPIGNFSIVPTERKFICVFREMFPAHMMERTHHAEFKKRKETFASIYVRDRSVIILARIFVNGVVHNVMLLELLIQADIDAS